MRARALGIALIGVCFLVACNSDPTGTNDNGNNTNYNTATGTMTASIAGTSWTANFITHATLSNGVISITGESFNGSATTARVITMAAANIQTTGTYSLAPQGDAHGGNALMTVGSSVWSSVSTGGSGSFTITTLNATHVVGTFSFVGVMGSSPSAVTGGSFDIPF
ncbi:MAG TPA: hypothetical protein VGM77_06855 [Gemmatimonadales bacterium]|jgi:hypothetical protein